MSAARIVQPVTPALAGAITMHEAGYAVQPCHVYFDSRGKKQITRETLVSHWQSFGQERDSILRAFSNGANAYLIACGPSGLVVADLDVNKSTNGIESWGNRPAGAYTVRTPRGGLHHYFINDCRVGCASGILPGVDIRGTGGGVFGPGSLDDKYQVLHSGPLTPWSSVGLEVLPAVNRSADKTRPWTPMDDMLDPRPGIPLEHMRQRIAFRLQSVTDQGRIGWDGHGFRKNLLAAALELGGYVGAGKICADDAHQWLEDAIRAVKPGTLPDHEDLKWIEDGLRDGARRPLKVQDARPVVTATGPLVSPKIPASIPGASSRLPEEFWTARPIHEHIRQNAHAWACPADAVLGVVLARLSSLLNGSVRVNTGVRAPVALNLFAILLGTTGDGKSSAADIADMMMPLQHDHDSPSHPLGSGQGLASAYGSVNPDGQWEQNSSKAFFTSDEGEKLFSEAKRAGSTLMSTLRSAWMGSVLGAQQATNELNRRVRQYSLGMWIGLQHIHAAELFSDKNISDGTLQRFLWFSTVLAEEVSDRRSQNACITPLPLDLEIAWSAEPVIVPERLKDLIYARNVAASKKQITREPGQEHADLQRIKVACLLAILDGRRTISDEDWELGGLVVTTSFAVANSVREVSKQKAQAAEAAYVDKRHRIADADECRAERVAEEKLQKLVARVIQKVKDKPGVSYSVLVKAFADRAGAITAITRAVEQELIESRKSAKGGGQALWPKEKMIKSAV